MPPLPPAPERVSPIPLLPAITPENVRVAVLVVLFVIVRDAAPRSTVIPQMSLPVPANATFPPIVSAVGTKVFEFAAQAVVNGPAAVVPQFALVHVAADPFVFQKSCA